MSSDTTVSLAGPNGVAERAGPAAAVVGAAPGLAFAAVVLYMALDYGRPQDTIPFLRFVRPSLLLTLVLGGVLVANSQLVARDERKFFVWGGLLLFMAAWVPLAKNNFWAFEVFQSTTQLFLFALAFVSFVDSRARLERFVKVWILVTAFQAWWGITHNGHGTGAFMGDENDFCLTMNMMVPFALLASRDFNSRPWRLLCFVAVGLYLAAVVVSKSRGGFVGLLVTGAGIVLVSRHRIAIIATASLAALAILALAPSSYFDEMRTIQDPQDSTRQARLRMWKIARAAWWDNPVLGIGQGNINWHISEYEHYDPKTSRSYGGHAVHSIYFTLLPELGLVGVALYLALLWLTVQDCRQAIARNRAPPSGLDHYARAVLCALAAFLVCGMFISTLYYPHFYYLVAISLAIRRIRAREDAERGAAAPELAEAAARTAIRTASRAPGAVARG